MPYSWLVGWFSRQMLWDEGLEEEFDVANVNNQYVQMYFIDIDEPTENIREEIVDAKVPYARVNLTTGTSYVATMNHMVSTGTAEKTMRRQQLVVVPIDPGFATQRYTSASTTGGSILCRFTAVFDSRPAFFM